MIALEIRQEQYTRSTGAGRGKSWVLYIKSTDEVTPTRYGWYPTYEAAVMGAQAMLAHALDRVEIERRNTRIAEAEYGAAKNWVIRLAPAVAALNGKAPDADN